MKSINEERMSIVLTLTRTGGAGPVEVACRVDYTVVSEDLSVTRSIEPTLTPAQKTIVKNFGTSMLTTIKNQEGVV